MKTLKTIFYTIYRINLKKITVSSKATQKTLSKITFDLQPVAFGLTEREAKDFFNIKDFNYKQSIHLKDYKKLVHRNKYYVCISDKISDRELKAINTKRIDKVTKNLIAKVER